MKDAPFTLIAVFNDLDNNFKGNTAAVVLLKSPLPDSKMQELAADFNQPATTFLWPASEENVFHVRWFAPDGEIDLCGHGSLAAFAFLSDHLKHNDILTLLYRQGQIKGKREKEGICEMYIEAIPVLAEQNVPELLPKALGIPVKAYYETSGKQIVLADNEQSIRNMLPDFALLRQLKIFSYAVTAPGDQVDFVSRTLVPHVKQLEDPATGSSHAALVPFWSHRLKKENMVAHQLSPRGGKFVCSVGGNEVALKGNYSIIGEGKLS